MRSASYVKVAAVVFLVALRSAAAANPVSVPVTPPQAVGFSSLVASYWTTPPYGLANPCAPGEAAITFNLLVRNYGTAPSPPINDYHAIWVQDAANPAWAGGTTLPAINAGDSPGVHVTLVGLKDPNQMQGHHVFNVTFEKFGGNSLQIPVDFPPAFCQPVTPVAKYSAATAPPSQHQSPYGTAPLPLAKTAVFTADKLGTMVASVYVWTNQSVVSNDYANNNPVIGDSLSLEIGHTHTASLYSDQAHTQVSQYTNSLYYGYVHFPVTGLAGGAVASAMLRLNGNPRYGTTCLAQYGSADLLWQPGDALSISGAALGGSPIVGQNLSLDVTPVVQSWAKLTNPITAFTLEDSVPMVIYNMVTLSDSCVTTFSQAVLDVTYYQTPLIK
jgi:hypothetical protein